MKPITEHTTKIIAITLMVLMVQFPILMANDGRICRMEVFYMMTSALLFGIFITHFVRKE